MDQPTKPTTIPPVNFIKHIDVFHEIVARLDTINFAHISLYLSYFRFWNQAFFSNPISPTRDELMKYAGLRSKESFYRLIRELESMDLLRYYPSRSKYEKSFYCLSHLELIDKKIKVTVYALTNHRRLDSEGSISFSENDQKPKPDIQSKIDLYNGRGALIVEKTIFIDEQNNRKVIDQQIDNTSKPIFSELNHQIFTTPKSSNNASYKNSQHRSAALRPSGVPIDPSPNYREPL